MSKSWWTRCEPNTDLDAANEEIGFMREDWQKVGHAFGFEDFVDPEVIIAKAELLTGPHAQTLSLHVDCASIAERFTGSERAIIDTMAERDRQDAQWGGPEHDDTHGANDWLGYIGHQAQRAHDETLSDDRSTLVDPEHYRERLVKIAALAFAAIESHDRKYPQRYDTVEESAPREARFQPYEDGAGEFRWRFLALNGQIMADGSEGYATRGNVLLAIDTFRELVADATVEEF